jgi:hypothetical protein
MSFLRWLRRVLERYAPPLGAVLPWVGGVLLLIAAGCGLRSWNFAKGRVRANATITENVSGFAKQGGVLYYPRFRFRSQRGALVQVLDREGTDEIEFAAGDTVPVLYPAGDPQEAIIATAWRAYYGAIVFGLWGTLLFDMGWVLRIMMRRWNVN